MPSDSNTLESSCLSESSSSAAAITNPAQLISPTNLTTGLGSTGKDELLASGEAAAVSTASPLSQSELACRSSSSGDSSSAKDVLSPDALGEVQRPCLRRECETVYRSHTTMAWAGPTTTGFSVVVDWLPKQTGRKKTRTFMDIESPEASPAAPLGKWKLAKNMFHATDALAATETAMEVVTELTPVQDEVKDNSCSSGAGSSACNGHVMPSDTNSLESSCLSESSSPAAAITNPAQLISPTNLTTGLGSTGKDELLASGEAAAVSTASPLSQSELACRSSSSGDSSSAKDVLSPDALGEVQRPCLRRECETVYRSHTTMAWAGPTTPGFSVVVDWLPKQTGRKKTRTFMDTESPEASP